MTISSTERKIGPVRKDWKWRKKVNWKTYSKLKKTSISGSKPPKLRPASFKKKFIPITIWVLLSKNGIREHFSQRNSEQVSNTLKNSNGFCTWRPASEDWLSSSRIKRTSLWNCLILQLSSITEWSNQRFKLLETLLYVGIPTKERANK